MIKSMTGFGVSTIIKPSGNINLEIKSLNSRNLDMRFSGLNITPEFEQKIKKIISDCIQRGSVKVSIELDKNDGKKTLTFDESKIKKDIGTIENLAKKLAVKRKSEISEKIKFFTERDALDENRLMQEVAYLIERSDITEETVRVNIHIGSFLKYLKFKDPVGKRLGFLAQEISREINTIGAKSPLPKITNKIVEIKNELEKIKEQIQNIL